MKNMQKLEKKFGKYAIKNLSLYLVVCYAFGYILRFTNGSFINYLTLNTDLILHGQIWRIVTWILVPPSDFNLFTVIMLLFYYQIGRTLESVWGSFQYNIYIFSGMFFTLVGAFLLYISFVLGAFNNVTAVLVNESVVSFGTNPEIFYTIVAGYFSTYFINMSIFLAYAATFPNMKVLLMFILPIKVKWLGIAYAVLLGWQFITGNPFTKVVIGASLLNFLIYFLVTKKSSGMSFKQKKRKQVYHQQVQAARSGPKHKCAICGRTEADGAELEFRYCSKCNGNFEYCQDHLFTHEHVK